jgi:hypothetical protein
MERLYDRWQNRLPEQLLPHIVPPARVESHHDDSVPASKWRGYDAQGLLCWYRHHYSQWDAWFDDDDLPMMQLLQEEEFEAWRCQGTSGLWVRRVQKLENDGKPCGLVTDSGFNLVSSQEIPRL